LPELSAPDVAKGLKDLCLDVQGLLVFHHPQSLFNRSVGPPIEGYIPFSYFLYLLFVRTTLNVSVYSS
jgi:hypothetical protein